MNISPINTQDLKLVKGAKITNDNNHLIIKHYGTIILFHNYATSKTEINYNCSQTSNKQIKYALELLNKNVNDCIDIHKGLKFNFSGDQE